MATVARQSNQEIIRHKVGLLNLAEEPGNVSKACQVMGLSRDMVYRYRDALRGRRCRGAAGEDAPGSQPEEPGRS